MIVFATNSVYCTFARISKATFELDVEAMTTNDLREALYSLEKEFDLEPPIGAEELPDEIRFFRVLSTIRDIICPQASRLIEAAQSRVGELTTIIADTMLSAASNLPLPIATVAKHIVGIGLERFCADPTRLLNESVPPE